MLEYESSLGGYFIMGNFFEDLRNKIKMENYNRERESIIRKWVANIGKIVEYDNRIVCYVEQGLLDRYFERKDSSFLDINGMNNVGSDNKKYLEIHNLDKPVYYIFYGIKLKARFSLYSRRASIVFKGCIFEKGIEIIRADEVTFENNIYLDHYPSYFGDDCFLKGYTINKITFINENFVNSDDSAHPGKFGIYLNADTVEIINTEISCPYPADIHIDAKNMVINNSSIDTNELYLDSDSITYSDSFINASKGVFIDNEDGNYIGNIQAPTIIYNGDDLVPVDGEVVSVKDEQELKQARLELIVKLYQLSNCCQVVKENRIQNAKRNFMEQPVGIISRSGNEDDNYNQKLLNQERIKLIKMLCDIKDYYLANGEKAIEDMKDRFDKQSISRILKRDDLRF